MRQYIYVSKGQTCDNNGRKYDLFISFSDSTNDERFRQKGKYYSYDAFEDFVKKKKPQGVSFYFDLQDEFEFVIGLIRDFIASLHLFPKHNAKFDLTALGTCSELTAIQFYWNTKQDSLWDVKKNTKLKDFDMMDYYNVSDFSAFRGSSIESLRLHGCNFLSSFTPKMHIDDFSFIAEMPCLKALRFAIIKDEPSEYYLNILVKCKNLEILRPTDNFFTFHQFAWLKAHMPQVKEGLEGVEHIIYYSVIGKRTPKSLTDASKAEKYQKRYDAFVEKYTDSDTPPSDDEKD